MTNPDTNTLNGALEQLGITMADNLNTMGVSDADPSDGLTTLAGKILDIGPTPPTPTPASLDLSLTAGKQILSYADRASGNEYATLSALVLDENDDPLPGVSVSIYKDNVLWYTAETGAGGTISKTYDSEGVGDVSFHAVCGSFVTESFVVEDCLKVYTGTYLTGTGTVTQSLNYQLPSTFEIEYDYKLTSFNQANSTYLRIGETDSKALLIGRIGNDSQYSVWVRNSGDTKHWGSNIHTSNDYQTLTITYDGSSFIFNNDITVTDLKGVNLNTLLNLNGWHDTANQGTITNIKIKPL